MRIGFFFILRKLIFAIRTDWLMFFLKGNNFCDVQKIQWKVSDKSLSLTNIAKIARIRNVNKIQDLGREKAKKGPEKSANGLKIAKVTGIFLAS